ncbi:hypothetical protein JG688_00000900 [Phytophthora aleatoria]|uniref:Uncharacterized protein n=1 Tax=Phytophthora aleatoria TaxID=2496075 RepID=A0A8J5J4L7_9STRA|nr:hypothetical protein JG688_00000900 [Phytophthora aleatoria]
MKPETWDVLCWSYQEETEAGDIWDEFEQVVEDYARCDCQEIIPEDVGEVEHAVDMNFDPPGVVEEPESLFNHDDGVTSPRVNEKYQQNFRHSPSSSFLAYRPLAF